MGLSFEDAGADGVDVFGVYLNKRQLAFDAVNKVLELFSLIS